MKLYASSGDVPNSVHRAYLRFGGCAPLGKATIEPWGHSIRVEIKFTETDLA